MGTGLNLDPCIKLPSVIPGELHRSTGANPRNKTGKLFFWYEYYQNFVKTV